MPSFATAGTLAPVPLVRSSECGVCISNRDACNAGCSNLSGHALSDCNQNCRNALQECEEGRDCRTSTSGAARRLAFLETGVFTATPPNPSSPSP